MRIKNQWASFALKTVAAMAAMAGFLLQWEVFTDSLNWKAFSQFVVWSDLMALAYFAAAAAWTFKHRKEDLPFLPGLKGAVLLCLVMAGFIFNFLLLQQRVSVPNILMHDVVPVLALADWLLFDQKGLFKKRPPYTWLIMPCVYTGFVLVAEQVDKTIAGTRYIYPFLDAVKMGWDEAAPGIAAFLASCVAAAYILYTADRLLVRTRKHGEKQEEKHEQKQLEKGNTVAAYKLE